MFQAFIKGSSIFLVLYNPVKNKQKDETDIKKAKIY